MLSFEQKAFKQTCGFQRREERALLISHIGPATVLHTYHLILSSAVARNKNCPCVVHSPCVS